MKKRIRPWLGALLGLAVLAACGSSSDGVAPKSVCVAGQSVACVGVGGCAGGQVCAQDGSSFGACDCTGMSLEGGPSDADASPQDATSDADAAPGWSPLLLPGLQLWTSSDDFGDAGASISDWPDLSTHGYDLPSFGASPPARVHAAIGTHDGAGFAAASMMDLGAAMGTIPAAFVVEIVVKPNACTTRCGLFFVENRTNSVELNLLSGVASMYVNIEGPASTLTANVSSGAHLIGLAVSPTTAELRIDGTATTAAVSGTFDFSALTAFEIGRTGGGYFDGIVSEFVLDVSPSDGDVMQLESYLRAKYGL